MEEKNTSTEQQPQTKFCKECGEKIAKKAVICPHCGCQVEEMNQATNEAPHIVINNANQNTNQNAALHPIGTPKNKWVALLLCFFLGAIGAHKFYEGKIFMGILYLFTGGLFLIGTVIDFIVLLFKPTTYYL